MYLVTVYKSSICIPGHLRDGQVADCEAPGAQLEAAAVARPRRAHPLRGLVRLQLQDRLGLGGLQVPRLGPVRPPALQLRPARLPGHRCLLVGRWTGTVLQRSRNMGVGKNPKWIRCSPSGRSTPCDCATRLAGRTPSRSRPRAASTRSPGPPTGHR